MNSSYMDVLCNSTLGVIDTSISRISGTADGDFKAYIQKLTAGADSADVVPDDVDDDGENDATAAAEGNDDDGESKLMDMEDLGAMRSPNSNAEVKSKDASAEEKVTV